MPSAIDCDFCEGVLDLRSEKDIERLRQVALLLDSQMKHLLDVLANKCAELDRFKGSDRELQLALALLEQAKKDAEDHASTKPDGPKDRGGPRGGGDKSEGKPREGHGPTEQQNLERVPLVCELDCADRTCPCCGGHLKPMKDQAERSEMIDLIDIKYQVVEVERWKYVCKCGSVVETALGPDRAVDGGRYSLQFGVKVTFDKFLNHLPLERQVRMMAQHGLEVTSQTLWDQTWAVSRLYVPTYEAIGQRLLAEPVIGLDQTSWPDLYDKELPPWQMWCLTGPGLVYHRICDDKGADTFKALVGGYKGTIICDDLGTHNAAARASPGITLAGCWAHIFRRFAEAEPNFPEARLMMIWIRDLYLLDTQATSIEDRDTLRRQQATAILEKMRTWMHEQRVPVGTSLGSAIRHTLKPHNWAKLTVFVNSPLVPLDNNATERGLRGPVIGRRNHFGSKSVRGTEVAAVMYSLVESAKVSGVDPMAYLIACAARAKRTPGAVLLPADFKAQLAQ